MKKEVKHSGIGINLMLLITVFFGSLFSSCYTKDDVPVMPTTESSDSVVYKINVKVVDLSNTPIEHVKIYPMGVETDANGMYTFTLNVAGSVSFSLEKEGYESVSYTVTLPFGKNGETKTVEATFLMKKVEIKEAIYTVAGKVFDGLTKEAVTNATGTWTLRGGAAADNGTLTIGADGTFSQVLHKPGVYDFVINATGKEEVKYSVTIQKIAAGEEYYFNMEIPMYEEGTVEGQTYTLEGTIRDADGQDLTGATVYYSVAGSTETTQVEVYGNEFSIDNLKKGSVTLFVKKDGKNGWSKTFDLNKFSVGTAIAVPVYMTAPKAGEETAEVFVPGQGAELKPVKTESGVTEDGKKMIEVATTLSIPQDALNTATLISTKVNATIDNTTSGGILDVIPAAATFVTGEFLPNNTTFAAPLTWKITNPFDKVFIGMKLQYSEDGVNWAAPEKDAGIAVQGNDYIAKIHHFSYYRVVLESSSVDTVTELTPINFEKFYLNNTAKIIKKGEGKFTYTVKNGYEYITSLDGYSENVQALIEAALEGLNGEPMATVEKTGANDIDVPSDWVYVASGQQQFLIKTYTFKVSGGEDIVVKIKTTNGQVSTISGKIEMFDQHHHTHGGHITAGGAGGGAGE